MDTKKSTAPADKPVAEAPKAGADTAALRKEIEALKDIMRRNGWTVPEGK